MKGRDRGAELAQKKAAYAADPEKFKARSRAWAEANREAKREKDRRRSEQRKSERAEYDRLYYERNRDRIRERQTALYSSNPSVFQAAGARRRVALAFASTSIASGDEGAIASIYARASELTATTGEPHQVDHIAPLQHRSICGLHVPANLRVITKEENQRKKNKMIERLCQPSCFDEVAA